MTASSDGQVDVAIIGGGVVGAAVARHLSRTRLTVALLEAGPDVGAGTSKANTAILHTGFDTKADTAESPLVRRGYELLRAYAPTAGIATEPTGALLVAWTEAQRAALVGLVENAAAVGYDRSDIITARDCYAREPHLGPGALAGMTVPDEQIICPWTPPLAFATEAIANGASIHRGRPLIGANREGDAWRLDTPSGPVRAGWVVNAAGLSAATVEQMLGHDPKFVIAPRRGELIVFDKLARPLVRSILLPVPTGRTKGVLVAPTVFGNVLLGPTAEDISDPHDTASTGAGLTALLEHGARIVPELVREEVTAVYAGVRAATDDPDYRLEFDPHDCTICLGGIRSTGLTASMALAEWVAARLGHVGLDTAERADARGVRMPDLGERSVRAYEDADRIAIDPEYGRILCHCERVTAGEIRDTYASALPPVDLDGLRRRTRTAMGRCQGFYCAAAVDEHTATFS